ncbi:hypothetical protein EYZ11_002114 [Aspergillus tanneri]|uniref:Uncharacterized protein n=1 Tax=Aspergillus tanneri TaxID=1220188 RepID=A0A4S3JS00_9EURO|nr:hypothetical protein EYZ11_002114 [Aspergillus tanneri]
MDGMHDGSQNSSIDLAILKEVLSFVQANILQDENINTVLASMEGTKSQDQHILRIYFKACALNKDSCLTGMSQFFTEVQRGHARPFALFDGQGVDSYFDELLEAYSIYRYHVGTLVRRMSDTLIRLAADDRVKGLFLHGLDVEAWLNSPESRPGVDYLTTAAVSLPLIGFSQLLQYATACINLGLSPGELRQCFSGAAGHSQGVVVAAFIATSDSWDNFHIAAQQSCEVLFWIGARCQQNIPLSMPSSGPVPSPSSYMLSVRGISQHMVQSHIDELNSHLPASQAVHLALVNGPQQFAIAGFPLSLRALEKKLQIQSRSGALQSTSQSRIPFSQRQPVIHTRFLPIAAPFHSPYLEAAVGQSQQDLASFTLKGTDLAFPVFHTETGENLQKSRNLIPELVQMICTGQVQWERLLQKALPGFTHVLDFGPGGDASIGGLVNQQRDGTGLRIIIVSAHKGSSTSLDYAGVLYARATSIKYNPIWSRDYAPLLVQSQWDPPLLVDTKFSQLLGLPPLMVAGMTPTTTAPKFVAAIMNAGYHAELACGGFPDADSMRQGIQSLTAAIAPGRGITCNLIYANPRAIAWQIPLLAEMRRSGVPITGLTIGAGVPSPTIVQGYIAELLLTHIALKPGSKEAIDAVLTIARANPNFPIILQWTGGRGGGHHSYEDFHEPILDQYGQIRSHQNVVLVAGSGFGDADGTYPYITGSWSEKFGRPRMPFDAILLGSRVMAAREAQTSPAVKEVIRQTPGVADSQWEQIYQGPAGGILSVRSEMGEPIHKLATRGVMLWAELDRDIFSLPRDKQKQALLARKEYYTKRLNEDFQKVWFGCNASGEVVDLHQMTYAEVWQRMVALLYLKQSHEWIDPSFRTLVWDFTQRLEERLGRSRAGRSTKDQKNGAVLHNISQLDQPFQLQSDLLAQYPRATIDVITAADAEYVVLLSRRRGQKPVPYIVALDEDLEYWFKKDSLWQSERIEAVPGQDVGRVCILHGPVAAQHTVKVDEPVKSILDGIHNFHAMRILEDRYSGNLSHVPATANPATADLGQLEMNGLVIEQQEDGAVVRYSWSDTVAHQLSPDDWLRALAGASSAPWCCTLFTEPMVVQGRKTVSNPIHRLFAAHPGRIVEVQNPHSPGITKIVVKEVKEEAEAGGGVKRTIVSSASLRNGPKNGEIILTLWDHTAVDRAVVALDFQFKYKPCRGAPSITEVMTDRNARIKQYYQTIWIGEQRLSSTLTSDFVFQGEDIVLRRDMIHQFTQSIQNHNPSYSSCSSEPLPAPLDLAIAVAWKPIMSCLFPGIVSGDMLRLLHLSTHFELCDGVEALKEGDRLSPEGRLTAIKIKKGSGKVIEAEGIIHRNGTPAVHLKNTFILLGAYADDETTFEVKEEEIRLSLSSSKDIALLKSRRWLFLLESVDLFDYLHKTIEVQIKSRYSFQASDTYAHLCVEGKVRYRSETGDSVMLGSVSLSGDSFVKNPVTEYLKRHGTSTANGYQTLAQPQNLVENLQVTVPDQADRYALASGDWNPIHLSELFARYAEHDSRVTHGMFTSGLVRGLVESYVANNDPSQMKSWSCAFEGKVSPGDRLSIRMDHVAMSQGKMVVDIHVENAALGLTVLSAQAILEQPLIAYVFTGQGSQQPGMGMELDKQSSKAHGVWKAADEYYEKTYGFSITGIVKNNPKDLTVYFGGTRGRAIRENYISLTFDSLSEDGTVASKRVFPDITNSTRSYTFRSTNGLLHETQFTQPALALMEIARFEDMRSKGIVKENSLFAGHSLGEYVALTAMGRIFSIETFAALVFYRGLTMQNAVKGDSNGATEYSMCAVNPSRITKSFSENDLHWCVSEIARYTGGLLEIVNYNIVNMQYVCAGDVSSLQLHDSALSV